MLPQIVFQAPDVQEGARLDLLDQDRIYQAEDHLILKLGTPVRGPPDQITHGNQRVTVTTHQHDQCKVGTIQVPSALLGERTPVTHEVMDHGGHHNTMSFQVLRTPEEVVAAVA